MLIVKIHILYKGYIIKISPAQEATTIKFLIYSSRIFLCMLSCNHHHSPDIQPGALSFNITIWEMVLYQQVWSPSFFLMVL